MTGLVREEETAKMTVKKVREKLGWAASRKRQHFKEKEGVSRGLSHSMKPEGHPGPGGAQPGLRELPRAQIPDHREDGP